MNLVLNQMQRSWALAPQSWTSIKQFKEVEELVLINNEMDMAKGSHIAFDGQTDDMLHSNCRRMKSPNMEMVIERYRSYVSSTPGLRI